MGDLATLAKARMELEQLYLGIPDDSVNLTFQDLANVKQQVSPWSSSSSGSGGDRTIIKKTMATTTMPVDPVSGSHPLKLQEGAGATVMAKLPSLDFSKGLAESNDLHQQQQQPYPIHNHDDDLLEHSHAPAETFQRGSRRHPSEHHGTETGSHHHSRLNSPRGHTGPAAPARNANYDDMSGMSVSMSMSMSMMSTASGYGHQQMKGTTRRPGIPHSNICTICTTYIYIFRHRCLVCGRAYCRTCMGMGMGDMTEGRKCLDCLGRRFSQRYIQRAGKVGCCARYPSTVKQAELKWAEKGPRRTGERGYGRTTRSPVTPRTPIAAHTSPSNPASFVMSSSFSPYSPAHHHHIPF